MAMRAAVLGSGSGGNATVVCGEEGIFLIDAGLSAKQLVVRLELLGISVDELDGILLTHEHSDHARGLNVLLKNRRIPVYVNAMTKEALEYGLTSDVEWKVFQTGQEFKIGEMKVRTFAIPHDAAEPVGFMLEEAEESGGTRFGLVTDVGCVTTVMKENLKGADTLFIEANYDEELLENDMKRPVMTKQRIASRHGHLSNTQTGSLIAEVGCERLKCVFLGHLSSDCNNAEVAVGTIEPMIKNVGLENVSLVCASQNEVTEWVSFGQEKPKNEQVRVTTPCVEADDSSMVQGELF